MDPQKQEYHGNTYHNFELPDGLQSDDGFGFGVSREHLLQSSLFVRAVLPVTIIHSKCIFDEPIEKLDLV